MKRGLFIVLGLVVALLVVGVWVWSSLQPGQREVKMVKGAAPPEALAEHCETSIGAARVEKIAEGVFVAIGYDLANTILIQTPEGNVVIDVSMSPARARPVKAALQARAPGPTKAIVFTHSHIDHIGGASAWVEPGTEIWATDAFVEHFFKQYTEFQPAEALRGARQFGVHADDETLPCSALGRRIDLDAALKTGVRLPTRTFSGKADLNIGGVRIELVEAHGETHDQLFVWLPDKRILMPGDNYYRAFPNLYTIRGTAPRPVGAWIASLDEMRRRKPLHLVPSHTIPIAGEAEIQTALTRYRDGIQWVRDRVVQAANAGRPLDELAEEIGLPPSLADEPALRSLYGQLDWSARAIYTNHMGWFDGRPEVLYPPRRAKAATRTIEMMGGAEKVWAEVEAARRDDPAWSSHLLGILRDAGLAEGEAPGGRWAVAMAEALEGVSASVGNTNGRGYLLESAYELRHGRDPRKRPERPEALLDAIPIRVFFKVMGSRLIPERSIDTHESVRFDFTDTKESVHVTVRRGVAEVVHGEPLPGTPAPVARIETTTGVWRRLSLEMVKPAAVISDGRLVIEGDQAAFYTFSQRFQKGF